MRIGEQMVVEHVALARGPQKKIAPIFEIGDLDLLAQIIFAVGDDEAALADHPHQQAHRERAAAEAERKDLVAFFVVAAGEGVEVPDIAPDADPERAAEKRKRLEVLGSHSLIVERDLPPQPGRRHRVDVECLIEPPDVGLEKLRRAVSGAVGQQHDVLWHAPSPRLVPKAKSGLACFRLLHAGVVSDFDNFPQGWMPSYRTDTGRSARRPARVPQDASVRPGSRVTRPLLATLPNGRSFRTNSRRDYHHSRLRF